MNYPALAFWASVKDEERRKKIIIPQVGDDMNVALRLRD
jgi:hypothetical protein